MLKKVLRTFLPNPLDQILRKAKKNGSKKFLLGWNRGLGDIALGLYAIVKRIKDFIPDAEITFLTRKNLHEGFSLLEGVDIILSPQWQRHKSYDVKTTLKELGKKSSDYDVIIDQPDPTYWVKWQLGKLSPRLVWPKCYDDLYKKFSLPKGKTFIGVQPLGETNYNLWRNWPEKKWKQFFSLSLKKKEIVFLLFGINKDPVFDDPNVIDLRGKTNVFEILSVMKNLCKKVILPDSGILSLLYFLDDTFPIEVISIWAKTNHGILKQNVLSPNKLLKHIAIRAKDQNLQNLSIDEVFERL